MFRQLQAGQLSSSLGSTDCNDLLSVTPVGARTPSSLAHTSIWVSGS